MKKIEIYKLESIVGGQTPCGWIGLAAVSIFAPTGLLTVAIIGKDIVELNLR